MERPAVFPLTGVPGWRYESHHMPPAFKFNIRISIATNIALLPILHASGICYQYAKKGMRRNPPHPISFEHSLLTLLFLAFHSGNSLLGRGGYFGLDLLDSVFDLSFVETCKSDITRSSS